MSGLKLEELHGKKLESMMTFGATAKISLQKIEAALEQDGFWQGPCQSIGDSGKQVWSRAPPEIRRRRRRSGASLGVDGRARGGVQGGDVRGICRAATLRHLVLQLFLQPPFYHRCSALFPPPLLWRRSLNLVCGARLLSFTPVACFSTSGRLPKACSRVE